MSAPFCKIREFKRSLIPTCPVGRIYMVFFMPIKDQEFEVSRDRVNNLKECLDK